MNEYKIIENYRDDAVLRNNFNEFVSKIFAGLSFEKWYKSGCWTDKYIPYSLIKNNQIISNVSISKMNICIDGKPIRGIQIGTVGTLPEYRKQGLSKYLMEFVLDKFKDSTDLFFLFANETVLDFYPKFGFERINEVIYKLNSGISNPKFSARKLNINNKSDFVLIKELLNNRRMLTKIFGAKEFDFITFWHMIYVFSENIFYLEEEDIIVIYMVEQDQLHIWDIIFSKIFDISLILQKLIADNNIESIYFYFPPDQVKFNYDEIIEDKNSMLFVRGYFPLKGTQFKLPTTAQT
jgi:predicted N-acetyltransferase YhbS